jgi:hypothetical protein
MADDNVRPMPDQEGMMQELDYLPLPILDLQTATITLMNNETHEPETFVRVLYKDIGGEKAMWFPAEMAVPFGEEMTRLGEGGKIGGKVPPKPKLWTPS